MTDIRVLTERFGLAEELCFTNAATDQPVVEVNTPLCRARIALQGAQVLTWTPAGEPPVIWLSDEAVFTAGKSLRGGIPVCWPWFGAHASEAGFPAHGIARNLPWQVMASEHLSDGRIKLKLCLDTAALDHSLWPYHSELELHMSFGHALELELITRNVDTQAFTITEALHTYFAVSDVRQVRVLGLEDCDYLDKVAGFARRHQQGAVSFAEEVDRIYLDTGAECVIDDTPLKRRIHINKRGSLSTVVWNPWQEKAAAMSDMGKAAYLTMLCVETANAADNAVTIGPGEEHRLWVSYRLEK